MVLIKNRSSALLSICLLLPGCASMEAVQKYAEYSQTTMESVRPVAEDFQASCMRANSAKPFAYISPCRAEQDASKAILMVANVLADYGAALGALAADELVSYDEEVDGLTGEIKNLKVNGVDDAKVDAIGNLAKLIAKAATSAYQQAQVKKFLNESNSSLVSATGTLADVINTHYSQAVALEISAWEDAYRRVERAARDSHPLEWGAYSKAQWQARAELLEKLNAAKNLSQSIKEIGDTHTKLKNDANDLTGEEVAAMVKAYVNDATPVIKEAKKAFAE
jgi:hypothetical protein